MIEVHVDQGINFAGVRFWIVDRNEWDGKRFLLRFGKHNITLEEVNEGGVAPEPTFTLNQDKGHQFMKAMAELALKRGIKTESDLKLEGRLAAVEAHLEDMRRLAFDAGPDDLARGYIAHQNREIDRLKKEIHQLEVLKRDLGG